MEDPNCPVYAVLIARTASPEQAQALADQSRGCPYAGGYVAEGCTATGLFTLPASKRGWIEFPQEHPELLGAEEVTVLFGEHVMASSPWSRGEVRPVLEKAPCGTDCRGCPQYRGLCQGCPATVLWLG